MGLEIFKFNLKTTPEWGLMRVYPIGDTLLRKNTMLGTLRYDDRGMVIEVSDTLFSEPVLITRTYRVTSINAAFPPHDGAGVRYELGTFRGQGFSCGTAEKPEKTVETPLKAPRKGYVWKDGQWKKGR